MGNLYFLLILFLILVISSQVHGGEEWEWGVSLDTGATPRRPLSPVGRGGRGVRGKPLREREGGALPECSGHPTVYETNRNAISRSPAETGSVSDGSALTR